MVMKTLLKGLTENLAEEVSGSTTPNFVNSQIAAGSQAPVVVRDEPHPSHNK